MQRDILERYGIKITEQIPQQFFYDGVIDALFGVGLSRAPAGIYAEWIQIMNQLGGYKIAVDMPSGVSADDGKPYETFFPKYPAAFDSPAYVFHDPVPGRQLPHIHADAKVSPRQGHPLHYCRCRIQLRYDLPQV